MNDAIPLSALIEARDALRDAYAASLLRDGFALPADVREVVERRIGPDRERLTNERGRTKKFRSEQAARAAIPSEVA